MPVVLSGSFRRDPVGLREAHAELARLGCRVLSPVTVEFVHEAEGFAYSADQLDSTVHEIESAHLRAITESAFVWLHDPNGYIGVSAALEVGTAAAAGVPVFARQQPSDVTLQQFVRVVENPEAAVASAVSPSNRDAGQPLRALQAYYARMASRRGWDRETPEECLLLLVEEVGELAHALRVSGAESDAANPRGAIAEELADVQLYVVHMANVLGLEIADAVDAKEAVNEQRFLQRARSG
jgi:NTP pyrophosphatase (non-canonical NTP hydrolase)